jgi:hypothetical protein
MLAKAVDDASHNPVDDLDQLNRPIVVEMIRTEGSR